MTRYTIAVLISAILCGCSGYPTHEELVAADAASKDAMFVRLRDVWSPKCQMIGYEPMTSEWKSCVSKLMEAEDQQKAASLNKEAADRAYWGQAIQNFGNTVYGPGRIRPQTTTTTCSPVGSTVSCTSTSW